ncbi:hypothetical protein ACWDZ5_33515, partial [Streptomyces sp. NPDC002996]
MTGDGVRDHSPEQEVARYGEFALALAERPFPPSARPCPLARAGQGESAAALRTVDAVPQESGRIEAVERPPFGPVTVRRGSGTPPPGPGAARSRDPELVRFTGNGTPAPDRAAIPRERAAIPRERAAPSPRGARTEEPSGSDTKLANWPGKSRDRPTPREDSVP